MAIYGDEDEMWRCQKHPSKRRRTGVCPFCLRDRLLTLCPDCANVRPCSVCPCSSSASSASSSSSSFASFSRFFSGCDAAGVGTVGRLSNLIDSEPAFRRSSSLAIPFLRSRSGTVAGAASELGSRKETPPASAGSTRTRYLSLWSVFKTQKSKKYEVDEDDGSTKTGEIDIRRTAVMRRSRSVAVITEPTSTSTSVAGEGKQGKGKGWHFPTPRSVFRQSKISKIAVQVQERSPMYRG